MRLIKYIPEPIKHKLKSSFVYSLYQRKMLLANIPYAINVELTNKCNLHCRMCPRPRMKNLDVGDMDFELFKKIVDDMATFANEKTSFTLVGLGEPLMYDKLFDAIKYVKMTCPQSPVIIDSNGTLLDEERSNMLIRALSGGGGQTFG